MTRFILLFVLCLNISVAAGADRARNVILFLGDAGGISTLHAASVNAYGHSQKLYIQGMPHIALMDTSSADSWVTDSAAGMSAIVTGRKTNNGVLSEAADGARGRTDGKILKTVLEFAEEKGLSTGVITNMSIADATPAACYAHCNERKEFGAIFSQVLTPRFGDGVDVLIGAGRSTILKSTEAMGLQIETALRGRGYAVLDDPTKLRSDAPRSVALYDGPDFNPVPVVDQVIRGLAANPKGYFLMVEWDMHADDPKKGLDRVKVMDDLIRHVASIAGEDTLIIFAADHSFNIRMARMPKGVPMFDEKGGIGLVSAGGKPFLTLEGSHTGEQVLAAAQGPGSERVHGFIENTDLFYIMLAAYGWDAGK